MGSRRPDIVIFALAAWDGNYSSTSFSIAKELSKASRVCYIDNPTTIKDVFSYRKRNIGKRIHMFFKTKNYETVNSNLTIIYPPLVLPINFLSAGSIYSKLSRFNSHLVFKSVKRVLNKMSVNDYIFVNSFNPFYDHTKMLSPKLFIYHTVDDITKSPYIKKHGGRLEKEMVETANVVMTTSIRLKEKYDDYSKSVYYLPNAAEFEVFSIRPKKRPLEYKSIEGEIIIFTGHLDWRSDINILLNIANSQKDRTLVCIGPVSLKDNVLSDLKKYKNVVFIPPKPIEELPKYLYYAHCAIIPFKKNELTESIYPLKVNEYLATGIPVVATNFSKDIRQFDSVISIAKKADRFLDLIENEILEDSDEKRSERRQVASQNTWVFRIKEFWRILDHKIS